jgi:6-phosphogluconolactonase
MFEIAHFEKYDVCMGYLLEEVDRVFRMRPTPYRIAMSGGSVLKVLPSILDAIDKKISLEIYLVDERYVPHSHPDSNTGALAPILEKYPNIRFFPFPILSTVEESRIAYEAMLEWVHFDLIVLGAGPDGHTASLFPHTSALAGKVAVLHTTTDTFAVHDRFTLSFERMREAGAIWVYFSGEKKSHIYDAFLSSTSDYHDYPVLRLREYKQAKVWYVREGV